VVNDIAAAALIVVGLAFGAAGTLQGATGRYIGFREPRVVPTVDKIRLGGWVGAVSGFVALLLAASLLTAGVAHTALQIGTWTVFLGGCALLFLRQRRLQGVTAGPHPSAVTEPWTLIGALGALVALALVVAASVEIAVEGQFCSWPQSATTLSGLGLVVSVVPALVAIRQALQHVRRSVAYWLMVVADVAAVALYLWLLSGHYHACLGG
jgi:hypothetical protein